MDDTTPFRPIIRTQSDLEELWRTLIRPLGFARRSVWWMLVTGEGVPIPQMTEFEDADTPPDDDERESFASLLQHVVPMFADAGHETPTRIAFLLSRPGDERVRPVDQEWAAALYDVAGRAGLSCETVHLATDRDIRPLPLDSLGSRDLAAV